VTHLLDRIAAFIDGELDHAERDRVLVHLASCVECRNEVAAHRAVKSRLAHLAPTEPSPTLLAEIRRLAEPGEPLAPATGEVGSRALHRRARPVRRAVASGRTPLRPWLTGTDRATRPPAVGVGGRPPRGGERRHGRSRRVRGFASVTLIAVTTTLVTAFAVGGAPTSEAPQLRPDLDSFLVEHATTSRDVPFAPLQAETVDVSFRTGGRR